MNAVCKSTRYGQGCGHAVDDHVGNQSPNQDCCCCNWQHNVPGHRENCIECLRREHGKPGMTAGEFEPFLPEHLRQPYWRQKIEQFFREQGLDPDADT